MEKKADSTNCVETLHSNTGAGNAIGVGVGGNLSMDQEADHLVFVSETITVLYFFLICSRYQHDL